MEEIELGKYRHFKGAIVEVIALAKHSETLKEMVVYKHLDTNEIWVREASMWHDKKEYNGNIVNRFEYIG